VHYKTEEVEEVAASVYGYTVRERVARPGRRIQRVCVQVHYEWTVKERVGQASARDEDTARVCIGAL